MLKQEPSSSRRKVHTCKFCSKEFSKISSLSTHLLIHERSPHMCNVCNKLFSQKKQFTDHVLSHNGGDSVMCEKCFKIFPQTKSLVRHLLTHNETPYICKVCNEAFSENMLLVSHVKTHIARTKLGRSKILTSQRLFHDPMPISQKTQMCKVFSPCISATTSLQATQEQPIKKESYFSATCNTGKNVIHSHTDEIVFECEMCEEVFSQESLFAFHLLVHAKEQHFSGKVSTSLEKAHNGRKKSTSEAPNDEISKECVSQKQDTHIVKKEPVCESLENQL